MAAPARTEELPHGAAQHPSGGVKAAADAVLAGLRRIHAEKMAEHASYALAAEIVAQIRQQEPSNLAKQAAYSLLYAIPSVLIVLVSLAAIVDKNTNAGVSVALQVATAEHAPADVRPLLASLVETALVETSLNTAMVAAIVSLAIAIWGGAGGVGALVYAVNRTYGVKSNRSFVRAALVNVGLMVSGGILVVTSLLLLTFGRRIGEWLATQVGYGSTLVDFLLSGPIWALVLLFASLLLLYWFGLDSAKSFRWLLPGAAAATVAIAVVFALFGLILSFSNPGSAYGAAGSVLVLLWTLFVLSLIVVIGAIVNAVFGRRYDRKLKGNLHRHPEKQLDRKTIAVSEYR